MQWRDLRIAFRRVLRRPQFAVPAVLLIGSSVGITATIGSAAYVGLVSALPYPDEGRLVFLYWSRPDPPIPDMSLSLRVTRELKARSDAFDAVGATLTPVSATLQTAEGPVHLNGGIATPESFQVLGLRPLLGRAFTEAEGEPGASSRVAVLSHEAWGRLLDGSADAVGSDLVIDDMVWTVVGVLPPGRSLAPERNEPVDIWFPTGGSEAVLGRDPFPQPGARWFRTTSRLSVAAAQAPLRPELDRVAAGLAEDYPESHRGWRLNADPLRTRVFGSTDPMVALSLGALLFWAIALLNLYGLFVQTAEQEARDTAIRVAIGAGRGRIWRYRFADALVAGSAGSVLAFATALIGFEALRASNPLQLPAYATVGLGYVHLILIPLISLASVFAMAGVAGAAADSAAALGLRSGLRPHGSPVRARASYVALALQVAISTFLTVGAVAAARSLDELRSRDVGVETADMLSARVEVPPGPSTSAEVARKVRDVVDGLRELPGVADAFVWSPEIPTDAHTFTRVRIESPSEALDDDVAVVRFHSASPGAVTAFGLRVIAGRDLQEDDRDAGRRVALVSASAAAQWWGGDQQALGQRIQRTVHDQWSEVVGVVADAPMSGRFGPGSANTLDAYFMFDQDPRRTFQVFVAGRTGVVDVGAVRSASSSIMPDAPLFDVRWMRDRVRDQEKVHSATAWLGGAYALASLLLAVLGLAGASGLLVSRRRVEMGIRQALGATRSAVVRQLLARGLLAGAAGLMLGAGLARYGLGRMDPVILTVGPGDPVSYASAATILATCVIVALAGPALRTASRPILDCLRESGRR